MAQSAAQSDLTHYVRMLALETGATDDQIRGIIHLIGMNRPSIVREARVLLKSLRLK